MGCKRCSIIMAVIAVVMGLRYYNFKTPPDVQLDSAARAQLGFFFFVTDVVSIASTLGFGEKYVIMKKLTVLHPKPQFPKEVQAEDLELSGVPVRIYKPEGSKPNGPVVVYFHGGGWTVGSVDFYNDLTGDMSKILKAIVVSVEYRLGPEHHFPAAFEDCRDVTLHILQHGKELGVDPSRVIVAGDSAGGNLAAAVSLALRERKDVPPLRAQVLIYPAVQALDFNLPSFQKDGDLLLTKADTVRFWGYYLGVDEDTVKQMYVNNHTSPEVKPTITSAYVNPDLLPNEFLQDGWSKGKTDYGNKELWSELKDILLNPYLAPLTAKNLNNVPQAFVYTAQCDVLRDEGWLYVNKLKQHNIPVRHKHGKSGFHGVISMYQTLPEGQNVFNDMIEFIRSVF